MSADSRTGRGGIGRVDKRSRVRVREIAPTEALRMGTALKLAQDAWSFQLPVSDRVAISAIRQTTGAHMSAIAMVKNETERLVRNSFVQSPLNYEHERPVTAAPSRAIRRQRPTPIPTHHWVHSPNYGYATSSGRRRPASVSERSTEWFPKSQAPPRPQHGRQRDVCEQRGAPLHCARGT